MWNLISFIIVLLPFLGITFGQWRCNVCFRTGIACVDSQSYIECGDSTVKDICPNGSVCADTEAICSTPSETVSAACNGNTCSDCSLTNNRYACLNEYEYGFCYNRNTIDESSIRACPEGYYCTVDNYAYCSSMDSSAPSCIPLTTTTLSLDDSSTLESTTMDFSTSDSSSYTELSTTTDSYEDSSTQQSTKSSITTTDSLGDSSLPDSSTSQSSLSTETSPVQDSSTPHSTQVSTMTPDFIEPSSCTDSSIYTDFSTGISSTTDSPKDPSTQQSTESSTLTTDSLNDLSTSESTTTNSLDDSSTSDSARGSSISISTTDSSDDFSTQQSTESTIITTDSLSNSTSWLTTDSSSSSGTTEIIFDPKTYCAGLKKNGYFRVKSDTNCRDYVYCYKLSQDYLGWLYHCNTNMYYNSLTTLCQSERPDDC